MGKQWKQGEILFWGASKITADGDCNHEIKRPLLLGRKIRTNLDSILKSRDITLLTKVCVAKAMVFPVVIFGELDYKKSWALKNWCFWTVVLEKTLERPLDCKEIKPLIHKGNQSWMFIGRTDAEAETPILWPPDAGKDWRRKEKGWQRIRWLDGIMASAACWRAAVHGVAKNRTWLSIWTELKSSGFLDDSVVKNPAKQETWVQSWVRKIP